VELLGLEKTGVVAIDVTHQVIHKLDIVVANVVVKNRRRDMRPSSAR
jgi:hypothetical protein